MAYLNPNVYLNGLNSELSEKCFIALVSNKVSSTTLNGSDIIAFSEIRKGLGDSCDNTALSEAPEEVSDNNIASYDNKVLTINSIGYSRTTSIASDSNNTAMYFAICKAGDMGENKIAYTGANFYGPTIEDNSIFEVIISGALSTSATLNSNSNFMFSGASISFSETDANG